MTNSDDLREAANRIETARDYLDHGDPDLPTDEQERIIGKIDEHCQQLTSILRELSINVEVKEEEADD